MIFLGVLLLVLNPFQAPEIGFQIVADHETAVPGRDLVLGFHFTIPRGWHIYWRNSGEAGLPTELRLDYPQGVAAADWQWPAPRMFRDPGGTTTFGYTDEVLIMHRVHIAPDIKAKELVFHAEARWLICREVCIPGTSRAQLKLKVSAQSRLTYRDLFDTYRLRVPRPVQALPGWQVRHQWVRERTGGHILQLRVVPPARIKITGLTFFPAGPRDLVVDYRRLQASGPSLSFMVRRLGARHALPRESITGVLQISFENGTHFVTLEIPPPTP